MSSFIHDVITDQIKKEVDLSQLTFILPNKRAGVFLKREIASLVSQTIFSPTVLSIEEFVEEISQLKSLSNTELLFEFYNVYLKQTAKDKVEGFDSFSKWAQILLQDFNEIDRYLIPSESIFEYLSAIQDINHWSLDQNQTPLIKNYLSFWQKLNIYYSNLSTELYQKGLGYQGLIYREAIVNLEAYIQLNNNRQHIFLGFNALNDSESKIIQELLLNNLAQIYWDIDHSFLNNKNHDVGYFIRQYQKSWHYFNDHSFKWAHNKYLENKNISTIGIPKNVGQAKYVGELLSKLKKANGHLNNTAVVLGDENLLIPVLNSLPHNIDALNITMGFPLRSIPLASLFNQLFQLHKESNSKFYYKDVIALLSNQFIKPLFQNNKEDIAANIIQAIKINNIVYLTNDSLVKISKQKEELINILFGHWYNDSEIALQNCTTIIFKIKDFLTNDKNNHLVALEYLYRFNELFNTLILLNSQYRYINNVKVLYNIYNELLSTETLDFQGEPLQGLQIMGMLESRVLDFETVIITSVNEGILPSGKSNNSFIPYDVKLENKLPTYKEKDAVYTYHFYRLIQRAKHVYIIYNTEPDVLNGGEKSRFITQLEIENIHSIKQSIIAPKATKTSSALGTITKTKEVMQKLEEVAKKGFSPSSLTNYIRNPLDFYYQKILDVKEFSNVEETIAANTLGTVVHNTLEDFYKPLENIILTEQLIVSMTSKIETTVLHHFKSIYKEGDLSKGKNLIIFEIAKRYVLNFLNREIQDIKNGNIIKIVQIEANLKTTISLEKLSFTVLLTGKVDRVDEYNGTLRIIDYKTGKVDQPKVEIVHWEDLTKDYIKYSKSFQVLMYAYMMNANKNFDEEIEAGIVSFKNLNAGFLKFGKKESVNSRKKESKINAKTLEAFEVELKNIILEIYNPNIDFIEKEV